MELVTLHELLKKDIQGKVVCFPTDTVYGIGAKIEDIDAIKRIYEMKHRDYQKPLAILCPSLDIQSYVKEISPMAKKLMEQYWPGALTLIFKRSDQIPSIVTQGLDTIGLRMPNSNIALSLLNHFGFMATTSVNISGNPSLNDVTSIQKEFGNSIDYFVVDSCSFSKVSSTVLDVSSSIPKILRQGSITIDLNQFQ